LEKIGKGPGKRESNKQKTVKNSGTTVKEVKGEKRKVKRFEKGVGDGPGGKS